MHGEILLIFVQITNIRVGNDMFTEKDETDDLLA